MQLYRIEVIRSSADSHTLRLSGSEGTLLDSREAGGVQQLVSTVLEAFKQPMLDVSMVGRMLYDWLNGPQMWLERVRTESARVAKPYAITIHVDEALRDLPWELLHSRQAPLGSTSIIIQISNHADQAYGTSNRPLRVLFMACAPEDGGPPLDFEGEERVILDATRSRPIELVVEESGSLAGLREQMEWYGEGYFDVFHLTGHSDASGGRLRFVMEDELGFRYGATAEEIAEAFSGNWPRLVFLSDSRMGQALPRGAVVSVAEALVAAGAPAVLGWTLPVGDVSASRAAASLYEHLAVGKRIDEAVARARRELLESESRYWYLLRLYADATPLLPIVTPPGAKGRARLPVREASSEFLDAGKVEVCPRDRFVGRRRVIQRCLRVLRSFQGQDGYAEGVLLHGMGGLGKSSLAARLCDRLHDYRRVVVVGRLDEDGFLRAFSSKLDDLEAIAALQESSLPLRQRLHRVLQVHLASTPHVFVFDDFEQSLDETSTGHVPQAGARDVLVPLLAAIREASSASRVIVTSRYSFPLPGPAWLAEQGLETMRGSELKKKTAQLEGFVETEETNPVLAARARAVGAGNPRLLERLDALLTDPGTDAEAILSALEATVEEFREELLLGRLLEQQEPAFRRLVALLAVYGIPVRRDAVEAVAGADLTGNHLEHAVALSLVDSGHHPMDRTLHYYVSQLIAPLVEAELVSVGLRDVQARAGEFLYRSWSENKIFGTEANLLEIHRLALAAGLQEIAADIADRLATSWINRSRFRDAEWLSLQTLSLGEDHRILHCLARAERFLGKTTQARAHYQRALESCPFSDESDVIRTRSSIIHNLAELVVQQGEVKRALELYQESLALTEHLGDVRGKVATLHQMAGIYAQQGEVKRALKLYEESLSLKEQIGDVRGKAATLHQIAVVYVQQGEVKRAMELYQESLSLNEQTGDMKGEAATLHQMAGIYAQQGEVKRAMALYQESLSLNEQIGDVQGKAATLHQMAGMYAQQGEVKRAMELYQKSLSLNEQIGDVQGKAAMLHQMAGIYAQQGEVKRALELYQESLSLNEQIGDVQGKAATQHAMAGIYAQQGEVKRALELYQESLLLNEQIGAVQGKAATLHQMAGIYAQQGEVKQALELYQESLSLKEQIGNVRGKAATLAQIAALLYQQGENEAALSAMRTAAEDFSAVQAWADLQVVIANLSVLDSDRAKSYLAQALWLAIRVEVPAENLILCASGLLNAFDSEFESAHIILAGTLIQVTWRTERHPDAESLRERAFGLLVATATARGIEDQAAFDGWIQAERLLDPEYVLPRTLLELEALVPEDEWLFDRAQVGAS